MSEKEFDKPLDTKIDEEVEVEKLVFDISPDRKTAVPRTVKEKIKVTTIYTRKKLYANVCREFDHNWVVPDAHKWIAVCTKCPKRVYLDPIKQTVRDGKIINRNSGQQIR